MSRRVSHSPTSVHHLPDLCLMFVFDHVPLVTVPSVLSTCQRWHSFRSIIYSRRKVVHLDFRARNCHYYYNVNKLRFYSIDGNIVDRLVETFTGITSLTVSTHGNASEQIGDYLPWLFVRWSSKLTFLSLQDVGVISDIKYNVIRSLNSLTALQTLHLDLYTDGLEFDKFSFPLLRQLPRLESIVPGHCMWRFFEWISKFYDPSREPQVVIELLDSTGYDCCFPLDPLDIKDIYASPHVNLTKCFTGWMSLALKSGELRQFCNHFTSISKLKFELCRTLSLSEMTRCIASLPNLTHLLVSTEHYRVNNNGQQCVPLPHLKYLAIHLGDELITDDELFSMYDKTHQGVLIDVKYISAVPNELIFPAIETIAFHDREFVLEKKEEDNESDEFPSVLRPHVRCFAQCPALVDVQFAHDLQFTELSKFPMEQFR